MMLRGILGSLTNKGFCTLSSGTQQSRSPASATQKGLVGIWESRHRAGHSPGQVRREWHLRNLTRHSVSTMVTGM